MDIKVVIADDQALLRGGFRALLGSARGIVVVAEASDGAEAVAAARQHRADIVLMDIRMPRLDGLEATTSSRPFGWSPAATPCFPRR
jgi:DNA-binding NarL/FixJ family response regulator